MRSIKFAKDYNKLSKIDVQRPVKLLEVFVKDRDNMSEEFIEYDTTQVDGEKYVLPRSRYLVLLFIQDGNLFTTVRRFTNEKATYYFGMRGAQMEVKFTENE
jgi:hypothetical protein